MIAKSTYETPARWPEKSAGELCPCAGIARLSIISKDAGQAVIFLDFLLRFALVTERCRSARQNEYKARFKSNHISLVTLFILLSFALKASPNLLGLSSYLSKEVLMEAADKTDVLPESVLFEILTANPDELRKTDLMEHLENKEQPLPNYMIEILKQMAAGTTAKTALLSQMGEYKSLEVSTAKEIIHSILIEEELDHEDLRTWLANLESYNGDRQIISSFIAQGDINSAQALMDLLPELYELNGDALSEHNEWVDLMNMQLNWQAEGRNPTDLTEAELATLYNLADNGDTKAKYQARGILEHFYGENYIDCCTPPDGTKSSITDFSKNDLAKAMGLNMEANPNPAKEYTEISYTLPFGVENADIRIFDVLGRLIDQKQLNSPINKVAYNTSNLPSGSYTIEIKTNNYSYAIKLIIQ